MRGQLPLNFRIALAGRTLVDNGVHTELESLAVTNAAIVAPMILGVGSASSVVTCDVVRGSDLVHVAAVTPHKLQAAAGGNRSAKKASSAASPGNTGFVRALHMTGTLAQVAASDPRVTAPTQPAQLVLCGPMRVIVGQLVDQQLECGPVDRGCAALNVDANLCGAGYASYPAAMDAAMHIDAALAVVRLHANQPAARYHYQRLLSKPTLKAARIRFCCSGHILTFAV